MSTKTAKKRNLEEINEEPSDQEQTEQSPPPKKRKLDENENENKNESKTEEAELVTIDKLKRLFAINTSQFANRYEVYQHFRNLSLALIRDLVLINKNTDKKDAVKLYQFVEFEFYCLDYGLHQDVFAHCDDLQLTTNASWYFHRSGNTSVEGYNFLNDKHLMSNPHKTHNKKWINPRPNVSFRGGTFKGLDITFGAENQHFGGILVRSVRELKPLHSLFAGTGTAAVYSPSDIIEGPCKCVNNILQQTGFESIKALIESNGFKGDLDIFNTHNVIYVDLAKNYKIKELSPMRINKKEEAKQEEKGIEYEKYFYNSPRVGLTLKNEKSLSGIKLENFQNMKKDFIMAPYRSIRKSCLSKIKRYKPCIVLAMVYNEYYRNKMFNNDNTNNKNAPNYQRLYENALKFGPFKQTQLDKLIKQCQDGEKDSVPTIKKAIRKFPTTNNDLAKLFGAINL